MLAGQDRDLPSDACRGLAFTDAHAYGQALIGLAAMAPNAAWSSRIDLKSAVAAVAKSRVRAQENQRLKAPLDGSKAAYGLVVQDGNVWRVRDQPPQVFRLDEHEEVTTRALFHTYTATLAPERRALLNRYALRDVAFKVVGSGSVGTCCAIALFTDADGHPLMLHIKQAQNSVLTSFPRAKPHRQPGRAGVVGQRTIQPAPDIFLGWTKPEADGRHFYVRFLKGSRLAAVGSTISTGLGFYADLCGRTLARAHARSADQRLYRPVHRVRQIAVVLCHGIRETVQAGLKPTLHRHRRRPN